MLSFTAPSSEAPVYMEQKSNKPSKTGLEGNKKREMILNQIIKKLLEFYKASNLFNIVEAYGHGPMLNFQNST